MKLITNQNNENGIEKEIVNIINSAKKSIVIVSPYIKLDEEKENLAWKEIYESLLKKSNEGLFIEVHARKNQKNNESDITEENIKEKFKEIKLENIYLHRNLHAKLYFNEEKVLITSLNLTDCSKDNIEIGYITDSIEEHKKLLGSFYFPNLMKDDSDIIKKRKLFLKINFNKLLENDIDINLDPISDTLSIDNDNYKIFIETDKNDNIYTISYSIEILNKNYSFDKDMLKKYSCNGLSFKDQESNIFYRVFLISPISNKNLLIDNNFFNEINMDLFHLIKILETSQKK